MPAPPLRAAVEVLGDSNCEDSVRQLRREIRKGSWVTGLGYPLEVADSLQDADIALSGKSILLNPDWVEDVRQAKELLIFSSEEATIAYSDEPLP